MRMIRDAWLAYFLYLLVKRLLKNKIKQEENGQSSRSLLILSFKVYRDAKPKSVSFCFHRAWFFLSLIFWLT